MPDPALSVLYVFRSAPVAAPYHYELAIRISPKSPVGVYHFRPGYPGQGHGKQIWRATFPLSARQRRKLLFDLKQLGYARPWTRPGSSSGRIGAMRELTITVGNKTVRPPTYPANAAEEARLSALCRSVEQAVPRELREAFQARFTRLQLQRDSLLGG